MTFNFGVTVHLNAENRVLTGRIKLSSPVLELMIDILSNRRSTFCPVNDEQVTDS